uniref:Putative structural protein n=1 Tax=Picornavirales N_OV_013 TaxID=2016026 RepID=A0A218NJS9_9VIRU|nr:putative structural protein [Picornavirales N_OV_013]
MAPLSSEVAKQTIVQFADSSSQDVEINRCNRDDTYELADNSDADLGDFLARPVLISTSTWAVGSDLNFTIDPWSLYMGTNTVEKKLDNYYLFRGDLRLRIQINGNPFYYGQVVCAYHPLFTRDDYYPGSVNNPKADVRLMALSQMPNVMLDPTEAQGGMLQCDYFYPSNYITLTGSDRSDLGRLHLRSMQNLRHANGGTQALNVSVFAYMENVVLTVPTAQTFQSEYTKKPVSAVASTVAKVAGAFKNLPVIGPYAKATEQVATTLGSAARSLGYSRPPVLEPPIRVSRDTIGQMSATNMDEVVNKLSLDVKQELSIDPRVTGANPVDEMALSYILQKESYLTQFLWNVDDTTGAFLWNAAITPTLGTLSTTSQGGVTMVGTTPMSHVAPLFRFWTGEIKFRFVVVASKYHQGRVRITIDPDPVLGVSAPWNTAYSQVIDISETREFEIDANWMSKSTFLETRNTFIQDHSDTIQLGVNNDEVNGLIRVEVLNELTTPSTGGDDISIMVYVRGGESLQFMGPAEIPADNKTVYYQTLQSEVTLKVAAEGAEEASDHTLDVYGGEAVSSVRQLLRRYNFYRSVASSNSGPDVAETKNFIRADFPASRGLTQVGMDLTSTAGPVTFTGSTYLNYFQGCYLARRGGVRYKHVLCPLGSKTYTTLWVERRPVSHTDERSESLYVEGTATSVYHSLTCRNGAAATLITAGGHLSSTGVSPALEVELPFYSNLRYAYSRSQHPRGISEDGTNSMGHRIRVQQASDIPDGGRFFHNLQSFVSAGEDFMFTYYLHSPPLYQYNDSAPSATG